LRWGNLIPSILVFDNTFWGKKLIKEKKLFADLGEFHLIQFVYLRLFVFDDLVFISALKVSCKLSDKIKTLSLAHVPEKKIPAWTNMR
jgi:hypothetical protein